MQTFHKFDWTTGSEEEHLAMAKTGTSEDLCLLARRYDWDMYPETVLGWIMSQRCVDLSTALTVFLNGEPERFNYVPKRDVAEGYVGITRLLDNICQRMNSGFYLSYPGLRTDRRKRLVRWLDYQKKDWDEGMCGRWVLNEAIMQIVLEDTLCLKKEYETASYHSPNLWRDLLSPVMELGVSRRVLRFLPREEETQVSS